MNNTYVNRRVVVTGCSSGVGLALSESLVAGGAHVIGLSRRRPAVDLAEFHTMDLTSPTSISEVAAAIDGPVHALFNCAGAPPTASSDDLVKVGFLGPRLLTDTLLDVMGEGSAIANIASSVASGWRRRIPELLDFLRNTSFDAGMSWFRENQETAGHGYLFGKEALVAWTLQQSTLLVHRGIRINASSPGAILTPLLEVAAAAMPAEYMDATLRPIGRASTVEEQVSALLFLNSDHASYITGAELAVDGGHQAMVAIESAGAEWRSGAGARG